MKRTILIGAMVLGFVLVANIVFGDFYVIPTRPRIAGTEIKSIPYTIESSGFYFITKDLTSTGNGIVVEADNVTIDLMGFSLIGPGKGSSSAFQGIKLTDEANVEVRNGTVRDFGGSGILENSSGENHRIIGVRANGNGNCGIILMGVNHLIKNCTVANNDSHGIYAHFGSTVTGNTVYHNQDKGIYAYEGCTVTGNTAYNNLDVGIYAYEGCTVTGNSATYNVSDGINTDEGCTVTGNSANNNQQDGIQVGAGCTVTGNTARSNQDYGIYLGGNCLIDTNTATNNNQSGGSATNMSICIGCTWGTNHAPSVP